MQRIKFYQFRLCNCSLPFFYAFLCILQLMMFAINAGLLVAQTSVQQVVAPTTKDARESIREKLVVLTFDDSAKSHYTVVRPLLLKYGFGATFFVTEGFDFTVNKRDYMTWEEIAQLNRDGFEIGNHTRDHLGITDANVPRLAEQLDAIAKRCEAHKIPVPTSFAWPGNATSLKAFSVLKQQVQIQKK